MPGDFHLPIRGNGRKGVHREIVPMVQWFGWNPLFCLAPQGELKNTKIAGGHCASLRVPTFRGRVDALAIIHRNMQALMENMISKKRRTIFRILRTKMSFAFCEHCFCISWKMFAFCAQKVFVRISWTKLSAFCEQNSVCILWTFQITFREQKVLFAFCE